MGLEEKFTFWNGEEKADQMERDHSGAARYLINQIPLSGNDRVLELGCGKGWPLISMAPKIGYGLGIDALPDMIKLARDSQTHYKNLEFRVGEISEELIQISNQVKEGRTPSFDVVLAIESIYMNPVQETLNQIYKVLKPGGTLGMTVEHYKENPESHKWSEEVGKKLELHSKGDYGRMLQKAGFGDIQIHRYLAPKCLVREDFQCVYGTAVIIAKKPHEAIYHL